jgi:asparagine synthase (glutamine-hydrolysing)
MAGFARLAGYSGTWVNRLGEMSGADDTAIVQHLCSWMGEAEHRRLCRSMDCWPVRRLFEPKWQYLLPERVSRLERLSAHATEVIVRLALPNDFLFKVDLASMNEGLEVRVPMLDEDLFAFGLSLPHTLKVRRGVSKMVLRGIAERRLPLAVAQKPKCGFRVPFDSWVDPEFKQRLREELLAPTARLSQFFQPTVYTPMVEAFCDDRPFPGVSRKGLYQRAIMYLSLELALSGQRNGSG